MATLLGLFEEIFGKAFWKHAIIEITFHAHHEKNLTINDEEEKIIEGVVNSMLKRELDLTSDLKATFIDSHYNGNYPEESVAFAKNAKELFEFANSSKPLSTKGIDFVLTELQRNQKTIEGYRNKTTELNKSLAMLEKDKNAELQRKQTMIEDYKDTIENLTNTIENLENDLMNIRRTGAISNVTSDTNSQHAFHATPIPFGLGISMCILVTAMIG